MPKVLKINLKIWLHKNIYSYLTEACLIKNRGVELQVIILDQKTRKTSHKANHRSEVQ